MSGNPCHHCAERHPGCHSECDRYQIWKLIHDCEVEADKKVNGDPWTHAKVKAHWASMGRTYPKDFK
jgi:hypothetical protein